MDGTIPVAKSALLENLEKAVEDFNNIDTTSHSHPRVGIVGEIYVKYNAFSKKHFARWLMDQGIDVVMPSIFEFFSGGM
jgi:predicted nucleotide-binding protein (sugar kinase/HSP70/actin superfamily)